MSKLEFGTAGMRGILGDGPDLLNVNHVERVIEGFALYLKTRYQQNLTQIVVVIGRDNRRQSLEFAQRAAAVLNDYNIYTVFSKDICPTPLVSYAVKHLKAQGAVNITASHNPKEHNGIKLYNEDGIQILPNEVKAIVENFEDFEKYPKHFEFSDVDPHFEYMSKKTINSYLDDIMKLAGDNPDFSDLKVAYSPLHGTGAWLAREIFKREKVVAYFDEEAMVDDTEFTVVENPNPESPLAYKRVKKLAKENNCDLLLVTDPDSDRVGLGVLNDGDYQLLTGNETAILIFDWLIKNTPDLKSKYLIYSFVSTSLPHLMAKENGVGVYDTATGFKWIGNWVRKMQRDYPDKKLLFAFEESYGSLLDENVAGDKDALQSLVILTRIASEYKKQGKNLIAVLDSIYEKYGYVESKSISIDLDPSIPNQLETIKEGFRNLKIEGGSLIDYSNGTVTVAPSDMLRIAFEKDWIALRPSGTEPKIKFYIFAMGDTREEAKKRFQSFQRQIKKLY